MSASFYDLLKFAKTGIASPSMTAYDKLKALSMCKAGFPVKTLTGVPPITFQSDGTALTAWSISGNMTQTGTPTPSEPIVPTECGDLVESGEHAGQYALPLTLAGQTQNIYLSEPLRKIGDYADTVEQDGTVTRKIKKMVLTGQETFTKNSSSKTDYLYYAGRGALLPSSITKTPIVCSHLQEFVSAPTYENIGISANNNFNVVYLNFGADVMNAQTSGNTADGLKEYLAAQYAAGTPVTIWYVLYTPTTETVTVPTLTPAKGSNTLSVGTTLQPSEVSITGGIK